MSASCTELEAAQDDVMRCMRRIRRILNGRDPDTNKPLSRLDTPFMRSIETSPISIDHPDAALFRANVRAAVATHLQRGS